MPDDCTACRHDRLMADSYRRDPRTPDEGHGFGSSWILGAAHMMALAVEGRALSVVLCPTHQKQLIEEVEDRTDRPCLDLTRPPENLHS